MSLNLFLLIIFQLILIHYFYFLSISRQKGDLADLGWTILVFSWGLFYFLANPLASRNVIIFVLILIWAIRLGHLILFKRVLKSGEDRRYQNLRKKWGEQKGRNFYILFLAQIAMAGVLSIPFIFVFQKISFDLSDYLGIALFFIGYQGVSLADSQLAKFKSLPDSSQKVCDIGLWQYSRHPNYFFEWLIWLSYPFFTYGTSGFVISLVSPLLMLVLLLFVTGVPPSEKQSLATRGDAYRIYQKKTSKFFPWLPSK